MTSLIFRELLWTHSSPHPVYHEILNTTRLDIRLSICFYCTSCSICKSVVLRWEENEPNLTDQNTDRATRDQQIEKYGCSNCSSCLQETSHIESAEREPDG